MMQIPMGGMDFHHFETCGQGALGGGHKVGNHLSDLPFIQLPWRGVLRVEGDGRRTYRHPAAVFGLDAAMLADPWPMGAGLAPGMGQLNACHRPLGADKAGDALQRFNLGIVPQAQVLGGDAAISGHGGGFGKNKPGTANGTAAQMDQMPVIG